MKHKLRLTLVIEYEADSEHYDTDDVLEMARLDRDDLFLSDGSFQINDNWFDLDETDILKVEPV